LGVVAFWVHPKLGKDFQLEPNFSFDLASPIRCLCALAEMEEIHRKIEEEVRMKTGTCALHGAQEDNACRSVPLVYPYYYER
jgi:hypothetical protein